MRRIKITVSYDGTDFHGWQTQPGLATIQGALEKILSDMEGKPMHVAGSGRTDAGVHALAQVAAFTLQNPIPPYNLRKAINRLLPPAIRVLTVEEVHADFHPRYDATAKTYQYRIHRGRDSPRPSTGVIRTTSRIHWTSRQSPHWPRCSKERTISQPSPLPTIATT